MELDRYRVFAYDEFVRLWCDECYTEGEELGMWPEYPDPVNFGEMLKLVKAHEKKFHPSPTQITIHNPPPWRDTGGYGWSAF